MSRPLPAWFFLFCLLLGGLFTVAFGWAVKSTLAGSDCCGLFGRVAVSIASFPTTARRVFTYVKADKDEPDLAPRPEIDLTQFSPIKVKPGIDLSGVLIRSDQAVVARAYGWRILVGAFVIDGKLSNAALALSPDLVVEKVWLLTEKNIKGEEPRTPDRKFVHGFDIMRDGSVIYSFDGGVSLQRQSYCGSRKWAVGGHFNHAVTLDDWERSVWTLLTDKRLAHVSTATGKIIKEISMDDIIAANPGLDILGIRQNDNNDLGGNSRNTTSAWQGEPFHLNDVEPLPRALAGNFGKFSEGDLLVSARSLNLIFVLDPKTLKVKWWREGATRRQHDPDWSKTGTITVFDNRMGQDYSRIVSISPDTYRTKVMFDGRRNNFYSRIRGKHEFTDAGTLLVTSPQQGRIFEIGPNGKNILEILNTKPGNDKFNYVVSQALWLPPDFFEFAEHLSCAS